MRCYVTQACSPNMPAFIYASDTYAETRPWRSIHQVIAANSKLFNEPSTSPFARTDPPLHSIAKLIMYMPSVSLIELTGSI